MPLTKRTLLDVWCTKGSRDPLKRFYYYSFRGDNKRVTKRVSCDKYKVLSSKCKTRKSLGVNIQDFSPEALQQFVKAVNKPTNRPTNKPNSTKFWETLKKQQKTTSPKKDPNATRRTRKKNIGKPTSKPTTNKPRTTTTNKANHKKYWETLKKQQKTTSPRKNPNAKPTSKPTTNKPRTTTTNKANHKKETLKNQQKTTSQKKKSNAATNADYTNPVRVESHSVENVYRPKKGRRIQPQNSINPEPHVANGKTGKNNFANLEDLKRPLDKQEDDYNQIYRKYEDLKKKDQYDTINEEYKNMNRSDLPEHLRFSDEYDKIREAIRKRGGTIGAGGVLKPARSTNNSIDKVVEKWEALAKQRKNKKK